MNKILSACAMVIGLAGCGSSESPEASRTGATSAPTVSLEASEAGTSGTTTAPQAISTPDATATPTSTQPPDTTTSIDAVRLKIAVGRFRDYYEQHRECMAGACTNGDSSYPPDQALVDSFAETYGGSPNDAYGFFMFQFVLRDLSSRLIGLRDAAAEIPGSDVEPLVTAIDDTYADWSGCAGDRGSWVLLGMDEWIECSVAEDKYMKALEDLYYFTG